MEIEKPFKCVTCNARFTNEDHLSVHKRRHEMSLNLKSGQSQSQQLDSFADETPTPTRFFRNCEEVGLFQDLQNVNPFDESFSKAASTAGTPSTGVVDQFDFSISLPSSAITPGDASHSASSESSSSKRRYSDHDTLNTPQVFGYLLGTNTPTATNFSSTTTTVLNPVPSAGDKSCSNLPSNEADQKLNKSSSKERKVFYTGSKRGFDGKNNKSKTTLKLNLSPVTPMFICGDVVGSDDSDSNPSSIKCPKLKGLSLEPEKKAEMLERNKAAAARSRQRRKQWVSNLESRCETLEKLLARAKADLIREHSDNQMLRNELSKHENCDVTKSQNQEIQVQTHGIQIVLVQPNNSTQPNILRQRLQPSIITTDIAHIIQSGEPLSLSQQRIPAKRGRPRKGQERRAQGIFLSTNSSSITTKHSLLPTTPVIVGRIPDE